MGIYCLMSIEFQFLQDEKSSGGDVPAVQWLRLCISSSGGAGLIPDQETKILATCHMA